MPLPKVKKDKGKNKLGKITLIDSASDTEGSEHELSHYAGDRIKLMKEVLKLIKPKRIKSMAPDCIKNLDLEEINSMLLEELLGISNKRLQYIFNGENVDRETSSSDSEDANEPIDIISLDDISDDDIEVTLASTNDQTALGGSKKCRLKRHKSHKIKTEPCDKPIKKEKSDKSKHANKHKPISRESTNLESATGENEKLMSVLELLELQARARAIRSQLALEEESKKRKAEAALAKTNLKHEDSDPEAVIVASPKPEEIVITSSESEADDDLQENPKRKSSQDIDAIQIGGSDVQGPLSKKSKQDFAKKTQTSSDPNEHSPERPGSSVTRGDSSCEAQDSPTLAITNSNQPKDGGNSSSKGNRKSQKVKLIRNNSYSVTSDIVTDITSEITTPTEYITRSSDTLNNLEATSAESKVMENLRSNVDGIPLPSDEKIDNDSKENSSTSNMDVDVNKKNVDATIADGNENKGDSAVPSKTSNIKQVINNECDNDEIVINLDEDEMDGMEND